MPVDCQCGGNTDCPGQQHGQREHRDAHAAPAQQAGQQRRQRQYGHRQGRQDVDVALARAEREEQQYQHDPAQRQQEARIAALQPAPPRRQRPRQQQRQRQPVDRDDAEEIERRVDVPGRRGVTVHGLPEQDVLHVLGVLRIAVGMGNQQHRQQPAQDRHEEQRQSASPAPAAGGPHQMVPVTAACDQVRHQHQQRQHADALGRHAQAGEEAACGEPAP